MLALSPCRAARLPYGPRRRVVSKPAAPASLGRGFVSVGRRGLCDVLRSAQRGLAKAAVPDRWLAVAGQPALSWALSSPFYRSSPASFVRPLLRWWRGEGRIRAVQDLCQAGMMALPVLLGPARGTEILQAEGMFRRAALHRCWAPSLRPDRRVRGRYRRRCLPRDPDRRRSPGACCARQVETRPD